MRAVEIDQIIVALAKVYPHLASIQLKVPKPRGHFLMRLRKYHRGYDNNLPILEN